MTHHPPFSSCLFCGLIDGWTLTSCPPSISPSSPGPEGPLSRSCCPSLHPTPPPTPFTSLFIIHYVSLWIQREPKHGWIHRQTQQFAQGYLSNVNVRACVEEEEGGESVAEREWVTDRLTNWLTETKRYWKRKRESERIKAPRRKRVQNSVIGLWNQETARGWAERCWFREVIVFWNQSCLPEKWHVQQDWRRKVAETENLNVFKN